MGQRGPHLALGTSVGHGAKERVFGIEPTPAPASRGFTDSHSYLFSERPDGTNGGWGAVRVRKKKASGIALTMKKRAT